MTAPTAATDVPSRATFLRVLGTCIAVVVVLGAGIAALSRGHHRPEGAAEHWLQAVGDSTRRGVRADAVARASRLGPSPATVRDALLPTQVEEGKAAFADLEVGRAVRRDSGAAVPFRLHQRAASGDRPVRRGDIELVRRGDGWRVVGVSVADRPGSGRVPSDGGAPPSRMAPVLWLLAVLAGLVVTAAAAALVRSTPPPAPATIVGTPAPGS